MIVTLAEMKDYLKITSTDKDAFLTAQLDLISEVVNQYCGRIFEVQNYRQTYYPEYRKTNRAFETYHYPVQSITSLSVDGNLALPEDYRIHKPSGTVMWFQNNWGRFNETVEIEYTAGYLPAQIPKMVRNVVITLVEERYNKDGSGVALNFGSDVQRISIPGTISIDFDYTLTANERTSAFGTILGNQANMLDYFRTERAIINTDAMTFVEVL